MASNQVPSTSEGGSITVLRAVSGTLGGLVGAKKLKLNDGSILTHVLRGTYRAHKIELVANEEIIVADMRRDLGSSSFLYSTSATGSIDMASPRPSFLWVVSSMPCIRILEACRLPRLDCSNLVRYRGYSN